MKKIKSKIYYSIFGLAFVSLPTVFSFFHKNKYISEKLIFDEQNFEDININNLVISNKSDDTNIKEVKFGVNRFDILGSFNNEFVDILKTSLNSKFKAKVPVKYDENVGVLSIAHLEEVDNKELLDFINVFFNNKNTLYRKIYSFTTGIYYKDFLIGLRSDSIKLNKSIQNSRYYNSNLETELENDRIFSFVGLDKETRVRHFNNFINNKLNLGVLEWGVAETHSEAFEWNRKYGNGLWWRNAWFYTEKYSRHATQVAELIAGKKGINPTASIVSVQVDTENWNGISGELNYLLNYTNIINNSWGLPGYNSDKAEDIPKDILTYNWASKYFDDIIYKNPELINIIAAGNIYSKKNDIFEIALSRNSIIVGATDAYNNERKAYYSQIGNDLNYLSVVAPGGDYRFTDRTQYIDKTGTLITAGYNNSGTSFSTPVITAIAGMLKQKYKSYFEQGFDSIIFKSSLITGSRKPNNISSIYTNETGYGIPNYKKIEQAIQSLIILPKTDKSNDWSKNSRQVYLSKGDKIRASLAFLYNGTNDKTDIDFLIKDTSGNLIASSSSGNKNIEVVEFTVPNSGFYRFEAYRYSKNTNPVQVAITYVKEENN